ncbi:hypothetical protein RUND412_003337 [Rhizina undulata]
MADQEIHDLLRPSPAAPRVEMEVLTRYDFRTLYKLKLSDMLTVKLELMRANHPCYCSPAKAHTCCEATRQMMEFLAVRIPLNLYVQAKAHEAIQKAWRPEPPMGTFTFFFLNVPSIHRFAHHLMHQIHGYNNFENYLNATYSTLIQEQNWSIIEKVNREFTLKERIHGYLNRRLLMGYLGGGMCFSYVTPKINTLRNRQRKDMGTEDMRAWLGVYLFEEVGHRSMPGEVNSREHAYFVMRIRYFVSQSGDAGRTDKVDFQAVLEKTDAMEINREGERIVEELREKKEREEAEAKGGWAAAPVSGFCRDAIDRFLKEDICLHSPGPSYQDFAGMVAPSNQGFAGRITPSSQDFRDRTMPSAQNSTNGVTPLFQNIGDRATPSVQNFADRNTPLFPNLTNRTTPSSQIFADRSAPIQSLADRLDNLRVEDTPPSHPRPDFARGPAFTQYLQSLQDSFNSFRVEQQPASDSDSESWRGGQL